MKFVFPLILFVLFVNPVFAQQLEKPEAKALVAEAKKVMDAFSENDVDTIVKTTHPAIFPLVGGKENYPAVVSQALKSLEAQNVSFEKVEFGKPTQLYPAGEEEVCFVPMNSVLKVGEQKIRSENFLIAIRKTGAETWRFLDGAGLKDDPQQLWTLLPKLSKEAKTPAYSMEFARRR